MTDRVDITPYYGMYDKDRVDITPYYAVPEKYTTIPGEQETVGVKKILKIPESKLSNYLTRCPITLKGGSVNTIKTVILQY